MMSTKRILETEETGAFELGSCVKEIFGAGIDVQVVPPSWVRAIVRHGPDVQWAIPNTKPVCEDTKEADSGSNPDGNGVPAAVGDLEGEGIVSLVAVVVFVLLVENGKVKEIDTARMTTSPAKTDQIIILLCFVMASLLIETSEHLAYFARMQRPTRRGYISMRVHSCAIFERELP